MLTRLFADNFRSLRAFELRPPALLLLVGNNGSGKTSLWEVLAGVQDLLVRGQAADVAFPSNSLTRWSEQPTQRFELDVTLDGLRYTYALEIEHDVERQTARVARERLTEGGALLFASTAGDVELYGDGAGEKPRTTFPTDSRRSFLSILEPRKEDRKTVAFRSFLAGVRLLSPNPYGMDAVSRAEADWLERSGSNVASWLRAVFLQSPEVQSQLNEDLREIIDGFQQLRLEKAGNAREMIVSMLGEGRQYTLPFGQLSEGQRVLVLLYACLRATVPNATLLALDEPDNFVALREIQPWLVQLSQAVNERGVQAIIVSHNPEVIDYLAPDGGIVLARSDGGPTRALPLAIDPETDLRASELLARGWGDE